MSSIRLFGPHGIREPRRFAQTASAIVFALLASATSASAQGAQPVTLSFTQATQKSIQSSTVWQVRAPTGSQIVIKASPDLAKQTKKIFLKYAVSGTGWQESLFPPGPTELSLNAGGMAAASLKFAVSSQWGVQACYAWTPPGSNQKADACTDKVYFEGVDPLKTGAEKLITFYFQPPASASAKQPGAVVAQPSGQELRLRVAKDVLMRSTTKKFRLVWTPGGAASLPASEAQPPGQVGFSFSGTEKLGDIKIDMMMNDWGEIVVPLDFGPHKNKPSWSLKACTEVDWSGEICSSTRQIELVQTPVIKMSDQPKDPKIDPNQKLPPPPSPGGQGGGGGGGGQGGRAGGMPAGGGNVLAPPPLLGAPAAVPSQPNPALPPAAVRQGSVPSPILAPARTPAEAGGMAPATDIPGCVPLTGSPGQYSCGTPEAQAACERQRASGASGIRACNAIAEGRRR